MHVDEPPRSRLDFEQEMDVAAVATHRGRWWEPRLTSRPAFMVSQSQDAAVWEDLKDIRPPMYNGRLLNLDRFLEKQENLGMTVTGDIDPAVVEKTAFHRF